MNPGATRIDFSDASGDLPRGSTSFEQIVERAAIDQVGQLGRIFVLPPEVARVDEEAVVGAVADDLGQGAGLAGLAGHDLASPALRREVRKGRFHIPDRSRRRHRVAVFVEVDEPEAGVAALLIGERRAGSGKRVRVGIRMSANAPFRSPIRESPTPRVPSPFRSTSRMPLSCPSAGRSELASQQVLVQPIECLAKVEKLDLLAVLLDRVIDQLDDLLALDPAVGVEDQVEDALLEHDAIERGLQVFERLGVGRLLEVLRLPSRWGRCRGTPSSGRPIT